MTDIKDELITEEEYDLMVELIDKLFKTKHFRIYGELSETICDDRYDELWYFMPDYDLIFKKEDESKKSPRVWGFDPNSTLVRFPFGGQYNYFNEEVDE